MNNLIPVSDVQTMAIAVAKSGLFGMKTPEQALALMLVAQSEGLHPARAALEYHIIQGRPSLKADAMLSRFQNAGGKVAWLSYTDTDVTGEFSHPSGGSIKIQWTMEMANKAGLTKNPTWKQYPRAMLRARCISEGIRTVYPGVSVGIYTPEEVQDFAPVEKDVTPLSQAPKPEPTPMPEKVKAAAKPKPATIEGEVKHVRGTVSGNASEGDLTGIGEPEGDAFMDKVTQGKIVNAFASIGFTLPALEAEFAKQMNEWLASDVDSLRQLLADMKADAAAAKQQAADMAQPDGGVL